MMVDHISDAKKAEKDKLDRDIKLYRSFGGKITEIPYGVRAKDETVLEKYDLAAQMTIEANEAKTRRNKPDGRYNYPSASTDL